MDFVFFRILDWYFFACGVLASVLVLVAIWYAFRHSLLKGKVLAFVSLSIVVGLFVWSSSNYVLQIVASTILILNALFYTAYCSGFLVFKRKTTVPLQASYPTVAVLIPAKNESTVIEASLLALAKQQYPTDKLEIFVIDDNSDDGTPDLVRKLQLSMPNLRLVANSDAMGKAVAINSVLFTLPHEFVLVLDADHLTNVDFVGKALVHFQDKKVACVQGINTIRNGKDSLLSRMVQLEYLARYEVLYTGKQIGFFYGSGAIFKTKCLLQVGGFNGNMLTEDLEVSYRLYESGHKIIFDDQIETRELATVDYSNFFRQRHRWFRGIWQSFLHHFPLMLRSKNSPLLSRVYYYHIIVENLTLASFTFLNIMFSLSLLGIGEMPAKWTYYLTVVVIAMACCMAIVKKQRWQLLLFVPLMAPYFIMYAFPNLIAMIDNGILKSAYTWVKTDRSKVTQENVPIEEEAEVGNEVLGTI